MDIPVLIAGGGPIGLGLAVDLGLRGISCMLVEMRDGTVKIPKMSQVTFRSMEICRRWGIAEKVVAAGWPLHHPYDFVYVTNLTGIELARSRWDCYAAGPERHVTPHGTVHCPQIFFDPVLRQRAAELSTVTLRYRARLESFRDEGDRVRVQLRDLGEGTAQELTAGYLVGCDGVESDVRTQLGIRLLGEGRLSNSVSIFFRSTDLCRVHDKGWARFYRMIDEGGHWADLVSIDGKELWRLTLLQVASAVAAASIDAASTFQRAIGAPFDYDIISILPWERRDQIAEHYGRGRVFIAGDSAHQLSPTGGLGMNTGIADAADLGWKLAAVFAGWGGPRLLDSYEIERKPVAQINVDESTAYFRRTRIFPVGHPLSANSFEGETARQEFAADFARLEREGTLYVSEHVKNGYCYEHSPICVPDGSPPPIIRGIDYIPNARPGARAPHLWLSDGRSILDLFGDGYVLMRLGAHPPSIESFTTAAARRGVPLVVADIVQPDALPLYERRLVLVRPDGHVAWSADAPPADAGRLLDIVRGM